MNGQNTLDKKQLKLEQKEYLELWKWFSDDSNKVKDRMWTMASFFYTLLGALLAYTGKMLSSGEASNSFFHVKEPNLIFIIGIIGIVLCGYGIYMIRDYGFHIRSGWSRADYIRFRIEGLSEIWCFDQEEIKAADERLKFTTPKDLPKVAKRLIGLMGLFLVAFVGLIILVWAS